MQKLAELRDTLPRAQPREKWDANGVAVDRLIDLYNACVKHQRMLPPKVLQATKQAIAAMGRVKK
jgi:hypothetical protein